MDNERYDESPEAEPVDACLLLEARAIAPRVGFDFAAYEDDWFRHQARFNDSHDAAYLDWLALHLFNHVEELAPCPYPSAQWDAPVWAFYHRITTYTVDRMTRR